MKKCVHVLFLFICYLIISGYYTGAGRQGYEVTGAENGGGNLTNQGCTCHSLLATPAIALTLELDSAGIATSHYTGGYNYTVKMSAINEDTLILPKFGFQICAIVDTIPSASPIIAGTWSTPLPINTHYESPQATYFNVGVVEQSRALSATNGNGGYGTTYQQTFNWIAPPAGTGIISFWAVLNAINNDGTNDNGDKWNACHIMFSEWGTTSGYVSVDPSEVTVNIFPNPAGENIYLFQDGKDLIKSISVFNPAGCKQTLDYSLNRIGNYAELNISSLSQGLYFLEIVTNSRKFVKTFVKN